MSGTHHGSSPWHALSVGWADAGRGAMRIVGKTSDDADVHEDTFILTLKTSAPPLWVKRTLEEAVEFIVNKLEPEGIEDASVLIREVADHSSSQWPIVVSCDTSELFRQQQREEHTFHMGELVELLRVRGLGADVEQTGGGVATIYAYEDGIDAANNPEHPYVAIGPGTFNWTKPEESEATLDELSAGAKPEGWDSEGENIDFSPEDTLPKIADDIVALVRRMGQ